MKKKVYLDGFYMISRDKTHIYLKNKFEFPNYYGKNLDALWDCLNEMSENMEIIISNTDFLYSYLGEYGDKLLSVFKEADDSMDNLRLIIKK